MLRFLLLSVPFLFPGVSLGVVVSSTTLNTTAPAGAADPGWDHMGTIGGSSGVYLGNGWVLTAGHVGPGNFVLGGTTYTPSGTSVRMTNGGAAGKSTYADLIAFELTTDPGLPPLNLSPAPVAAGQEITMIGHGKDRQATLSAWSVDTAPATWVWTETTPVPADASGYKWLGTNSMRWGVNNAEADPDWIQYGTFLGATDTVAFFSDFDDDPLKPNEAHAASNDSGGGVFSNDGSGWYLSGIMLAIANYSGQPGSTAVYGNATYMADVSAYRSQLLPLLVPEPGSVWLLFCAAGILNRRRRVSQSE